MKIKIFLYWIVTVLYTKWYRRHFSSIAEDTKTKKS